MCVCAVPFSGAIAFVAGGLVLLLPETRGVPLPDTIDDIEFPNRSGFHLNIINRPGFFLCGFERIADTVCVCACVHLFVYLLPYQIGRAHV